MSTQTAMAMLSQIIIKIHNPLGADILKPENGIIKNPNVVWYVPDYLIDIYKK